MKCLQLLPVQFHDSQSLPHSEKKTYNCLAETN